MKYISLPFLAIIILSNISCKKESNVIITDTQVGRSHITNFPILNLKGDVQVVIPKGVLFSDPGIEATESGKSIEYKTQGSVNTDNPGAYSIVYSAVNKDGYSASLYRVVVVYETDAAATAQDLSGNYARSTNGVISTWTKVAPGVYKVFNPGGALGTNVTVIAINPTLTTIQIPNQLIGEGNYLASSAETLDPISPVKYSWEIVNSGYGTSLRTFTKQ